MIKIKDAAIKRVWNCLRTLGIQSTKFHINNAKIPTNI